MGSDADRAAWRAGLVAIVLLGAALYAPALDAPFHYDDYQNIVDNPLVRWTELRADALLPTALEGPTRRPVAYLSFALSYYLGGGEPRGFRLVNVGIHLASALLVAWLALSLVRRLPRPPAVRVVRSMALFAGLVFVAHPLQTQTVTYVVQRMNGLAAFFCLLALAAWLKGRLAAARRPRIGWWSAAGLAWLLALGSKEAAIALPAGIWLCEWIFLRGGDLEYAKRSAWVGVPALLLAGIAVYGVLLPAIGLSYEGRAFSAGERLMTELRVVLFYLGLALAPLPGRLNLLHDFPLSRSLVDPITTLASGFALIGLAVVAVALARRAPLLAFGIAWFLAFLAVESFGLPLALVYEHRTYLPMLGVAFAVSWALFAVAGERTAIAVALGAVVVALLGVATLVRNEVWSDEVRLWTATAERSPGLAGAQNNLGTALMRAGRGSEAAQHFRTAIELDPTEVDAHNNLGTLLRLAGRNDEALAHFRASIEQQPDHLGARHNLAMTLAQTGRVDEGIAQLEALLRRSPRIAHVWNSYGALLVTRDRLPEAAAAFETAVALDPGYRDPAANLEKVRRQLEAAAAAAP